MSKIKACALCFREIKPDTKYNIFKHNTVVFDKGPHDPWSMLTKQYICGECMAKLQAYCQEGMYQEDEN